MCISKVVALKHSLHPSISCSFQFFFSLGSCLLSCCQAACFLVLFIMKCIFFFCSVRSLTSCVLHIFVSASFSRHNNYQVQAHWIIVGIFFSHTFYFSFFHLRLHGICIQWKLVCKCLLLSFTGKYVKIFYEFILLPLGWLH